MDWLFITITQLYNFINLVLDSQKVKLYNTDNMRRNAENRNFSLAKIRGQLVDRQILKADKKIPQNKEIVCEAWLEGKKCCGKAKMRTAEGEKLCKGCYKRLWKKWLRRREQEQLLATGGRIYYSPLQINPRFKRPKRKKLSKWKFLQVKTKELQKHPTSAEIVFERKLKELNIDYIFQYPFLYRGIGGISDFYLPDYKLLVEIDGGYHLEDNQQQTDRVKDFICQVKLHKPVLRLTNNQAAYLSISQVMILIEEKMPKSKEILELDKELEAIQRSSLDKDYS